MITNIVRRINKKRDAKMNEYQEFETRLKRIETVLASLINKQKSCSHIALESTAIGPSQTISNTWEKGIVSINFYKCLNCGDRVPIEKKTK